MSQEDLSRDYLFKLDIKDNLVTARCDYISETVFNSLIQQVGGNPFPYEQLSKFESIVKEQLPVAELKEVSLLVNGEFILFSHNRNMITIYDRHFKLNYLAAIAKFLPSLYYAYDILFDEEKHIEVDRRCINGRRSIKLIRTTVGRPLFRDVIFDIQVDKNNMLLSKIRMSPAAFHALLEYFDFSSDGIEVKEIV